MLQYLKHSLLLVVSLFLLSVSSFELAAQTDEAKGSITSSDFFFLDGVLRDNFVQVDFERDETGADVETDRSFHVGDMFAYLGARLRCLQPDATVMISGYKFKRSPSRQRSVGNFYVDAGGKNTSYQGTTRIDFCMPGKPEEAATVNSAGLFLEIAIPGHIILEAYNSSGHRLGSTMTTEERTSFVGFDSDRQIAYLLVKANYSLNIDRINRDFAIDDLVFAEPVSDESRSFGDKASIVLRDGKRITGDTEINFEDPALAWYYGPNKFPIEPFPPRGKVNRARPPNPDDQEGVFVMLKDGSVVRCELTDQGFAVANAAKLVYPIDSVIGYWGAGRVCMYPAASDFKSSPAVIAHPNYRIATSVPKIDLGNNTIVIDLDSTAVFRQEVSSQHDDPNRKQSAIATRVQEDFAFLGINDIESVDPSLMFPVWLSMPPQRVFVDGFVRTYDGQEFVLGGSSGFRLGGLNKESVTIEAGEQKIEIPMDNIQTIRMPPEE